MFDQKRYPHWSNIIQAMESNSLRHNLKHPIHMWPGGMMENYTRWGHIINNKNSIILTYKIFELLQDILSAREN